MSYRILLIALLGLMTSACVPYYRPHPQPGMKQWYGNPRNDYGNRQRYDYGRDRDRHDYRGGSQRYQQNDRWHSNGRGDGDRRGDGRRGHGQGGNWQR